MPVSVEDGQLAVRALAASGNRSATVSLVLDSGASTVVLFDSLSARAVRRLAVPLDRVATLRGLAGTRKTRVFQVPRLSIGSLALENLQVVDGRGAAGRRVADGLLPTGLFDCVYFAPAAGYAVLEPATSLQR